MKLETVSDWLTWAGIVLPLSGLAFSAVVYVLTWRNQIKLKNEERLYFLLGKIDDPAGALASKIFASYELRNYTSHADLIVRFFKEVKIGGPEADLLKGVMLDTAEYFSKRSKKTSSQ